MSGLYGGRYRNSAPADFMSCSTRAPLWAGKLSMTTISPCERVGSRHFSTHSSNRAASMLSRETGGSAGLVDEDDEFVGGVRGPLLRDAFGLPRPWESQVRAQGP